jgi:uncharacterized protein (TIGR02646 family)
VIQLPNLRLSKEAKAGLKRLQNAVDQATDYAKRVTAAKASFSNQNKTTNKTFKVVRETLTKMCSGARRCGYCEDSVADEVEHIKPKDLYPEVVFVWENYLYSCGPCNGPKNNQFAVLNDATGELIDVTRKTGMPVKPPEKGNPALINPREENPFDFIELDLLGTFYFLPIAKEGSKQFIRADYTIKVLRLNDRDYLQVARGEAFSSYRARLTEYIKSRDEGGSEKELKALIDALKRMQHPTVWQEMKRQSDLIPELRKLFKQAPESLDW